MKYENDVTLRCFALVISSLLVDSWDVFLVMTTSLNGFTRHWTFVYGIHRWISLTKASNAGLSCFLWSPWTDGWGNDRDAGDLKRHRAYCDVTVMFFQGGFSGIGLPWNWIYLRYRPQKAAKIQSNQISKYQSTHYGDVLMSVMASQITCVSIVCATVCSGADQRKHQSPMSLTWTIFLVDYLTKGQ